LGILIIAGLALAPLSGMASDAMDIEGEINDSFQLVDDNGQTYEIAETSQGNELAENYVGEKVKVTGTIQEDGEIKIISVTTFSVIE